MENINLIFAVLAIAIAYVIIFNRHLSFASQVSKVPSHERTSC